MRASFGWQASLRSSAFIARIEAPRLMSAKLTQPSDIVILNVDDSPESLYIKDRLLRLKGYTVANATTGKAAIDLAHRLHPHLILLDVHLPDIDGREVCRRIKEHPDLNAIPVVLVSATVKGHAEHLEGLRWAGADGYIAEPFESEAFESTIRTLLANRV